MRVSNGVEPLDNQKQNSPTSQNASPSAGVGAFIWDLVKILVIALAIILPFRAYVAEPFVVSGSSMLPNFHNHDYLIIDRFSYIKGQPERGDVVVLKFPKDPSQFFIKRVIGLPGEKVCFALDCKGQDGHVYIFNAQHPEGFRLLEPYLNHVSYGQPRQSALGQDEYFVLGDNRGASSDSRVWGVLPRGNIVGKAWARVYPFSQAEFIDSPSY